MTGRHAALSGFTSETSPEGSVLKMGSEWWHWKEMVGALAGRAWGGRADSAVKSINSFFAENPSLVPSTTQ